jgi:intracellular multiplication protein IcmQ
MKNELTQKQTDAILQALDKAIATGPWDDSNFLRVIGKNLSEMRNSFSSQLGASLNLSEVKDPLAGRRQKQQASDLEVFIALYSSEGNSLQSWERVLANLPRQLISRPIYADEEEIKYLLKSKANKINEAYVVAYITQDDILTIQQERKPLDKFGKTLMSLKDRSLNLDNITRFEHVSGTYNYIKGRLVKTH